MVFQYCCTYWGRESQPPIDFLADAVAAGYDGVEINLASGNFNTPDFRNTLDRLRAGGLIFIAQQVPHQPEKKAQAFIQNLKKSLESIARFQPDFINAHTGSDFYTFEDNCRIIEAVEDFSEQRNTAVYHETHRARFAFHLPTLMPYLSVFPQLKLTGDFSHWCCVSESLLEEQSDLLAQVFPRVHHLHARVGSEQTTQISDPFAPEWTKHLQQFCDWWQQVVTVRKAHGQQTFTLTPEAGPFPYMPEQPYTRKPLSAQWEVNLKMKEHLKNYLK